MITQQQTGLKRNTIEKFYTKSEVTKRLRRKLRNKRKKERSNYNFSKLFSK